jgi:two-component system sensor histidine kinase AgrC
VPMSRFYQLFIKRNDALLQIIFNAFILCAGAVILIKKSPDNFFQHYIALSIMLLILVFINAEVLHSHRRSLEQQKKLDAYMTYLPVVESLIEQVREKQHEYDNNIQTIRALGYTCKDFNELQSALIDTTDFLLCQNDFPYILKINLHLVAGFLVSKSIDALHRNLDLKINIENYHLDTKATEYEIIEYLGILIDNAVEASPEHSTIYINISSHDQHLFFRISNPGPVLTPDFCKNIFTRGYTTKTDPASRHGLGLYHLNKSLKDKNGELNLGNETIDGMNYIWFLLDI